MQDAADEPGISGLGIELVVDDLDRAVEMFTDVVGCELISRGPSQLITGEMAVIDAGAFVISLLCPAASGPGTILSERTPRLSQIMFGSADSSVVDAARERSIEAGAATSDGGEGRFHLTPECVEGALGIPVALVVTTVAES
jgi:catechol 2,3-dioxygenase-like lactoylglutathione lyase family enzyme